MICEFLINVTKTNGITYRNLATKRDVINLTHELGKNIVSLEVVDISRSKPEELLLVDKDKAIYVNSKNETIISE